MKRKSLLIMLLVALFVPLAVNAQDMALRKKSRVITPDLEVKSLNRAISSLNVQNGMLNNGPVQSSNLESRNFNTMSSSNATSGRGTRATQYEKVTSELSDWSGNYILGVSGSDFVYAFDGDVYDASSYYGYNVAGYTELALSNNTISDAGDAAILTFEEYGGYGLYTIKVNDEYYLGSDSISGLKTASSLSSVDYLWDVYWYSAQNIPILFSYSDGSECYGIVFYNENDGSSTYGGFSNYELSYSGSTFSYYYTGLFKETTSGGGSTDCGYELVTAAESDWSGDYVITAVNGTTAHVLSGVSNNVGTYADATITDNILADADVAAYNVTITKLTISGTTYYTLKLGNSYLRLNQNGSSLNSNTTDPSTQTGNTRLSGCWTISYTNNYVKITNARYTSRYIRWNNQTGSYRFACYQSTSTNMLDVSLFKKITDCEPVIPCNAPTALNTTDITNTTATLNWTGDSDGYSVRYRKGFVYDFESAEPWTYTDFTPCTTYDGDGGTTYGLSGYTFTNQYYVGACIAFQNGINSNMASHDGNAFGAMFNSSDGQSNDWFILPELTIEEGDVFSFWIREITTQYGDETINVGVCDKTDGTFSSYLAQNVAISSTTYTELSYDLSSYKGQTIKLAINCVSNDVFGIMIDDIFVGNPRSSWSTPISVTGNTYTLEGLDMNSNYTWQVQGNCDSNTTSWISDYFTTLSSIFVQSITADDVTVLVGATATITPTVLPTDATNPAVTYTSGNEAIATVDANGVVTGVASGNTTITIAATDGSSVTATINVTVNGIDVTGITASDVTVVNGQTATISYTVAPTNASDPSVTFTSADETVATVDASGVVTGVAVGTTTITIASVSNPEVTATINVTVTSDPNAVQFTVEAPANAHPGDVITVSAVLTAPTSGSYAGFTDLLMRIFYDNTAFQFVNGSMVYGPVVSQAQQYGSQITPNTSYLADAIQLGINCYDEGIFVTAEGIVFSAQFTVLTGAEGDYTFTAQPKDEMNFDHEGQPIAYEVTPSTVTITIPQTFTKHIIGYEDTENGGDGGNYYLIASPIGDIAPTAVTNMISNKYDLFSFNQEADIVNNVSNEWENYKVHSFGLVHGHGYLYANNNSVDLEFTGDAYTGTGDNGTEDITLIVASETSSDKVKGLNLIGNPFGTAATLNKAYYRMQNAGELTAGTGAIGAMEGVFVVAETNGETVTFTPNGSKTDEQLVINITQGRSNIDRAIVRFGNEDQLPKVQLFGNSTKVFIPQGTKDFAVVSAEAQGEMPVNFKADSNGTYTLSVNAENVEFSYLHLIDNMTGAEVDLLETPSYSFNATTSDYTSRFKLVFAQGNNSNSDEFAFISNGNIIVNGEGMLQVIDMTGRMISTNQINGVSSLNLNAAAGVYVLQLTNGESVKTQKIVVK